MAVRETSLIQWMLNQGNFEEQEGKIWEFIYQEGPSCIADVSSKLKFRTSSVSARMNHLKKTGWLESIGKQKSKTTGKLSNFYKAVFPVDDWDEERGKMES